jgi:hypothetical protein
MIIIIAIIRAVIIKRAVMIIRAVIIIRRIIIRIIIIKRRRKSRIGTRTGIIRIIRVIRRSIEIRRKIRIILAPFRLPSASPNFL